MVQKNLKELIETVDTICKMMSDAGVVKETPGGMSIKETFHFELLKFAVYLADADMMIDYETGAPFTAHTTNPVPFILVNYDEAYTLKEDGCLADIVPTLIECMGMEKPAEMTGSSLLIKK